MKHVDLSGKTAALLLLAVLTLAAGLRLWQLDRPALWEDDYFNLSRGLMPLGDMFHAQKYAGPTETFHDYQPPLHYALLHAALALSKTSLAARLVSVAAGLLSILGLYRLGGALFGTRAGLFAALLAALSLFFIDGGRSIKTYSVYFCASIWALHFLWQALIAGRTRLWWAYAPCAAAMVYSSFLGVPGLGGQLTFAGLVLAGEAISRKPGWERRTGYFTLACLGVLALCLPWLEAVVFIRNMFHNPGVNPLAQLSWAKGLEFLGGFVSHVFETPPWGWAGLPLLAVVGCVAALAKSRIRGLALLALWAGLPVAALLTSRSEMSEALSTRHFYNMFGFLVLLGGLGTDAVLRLALGRFNNTLGLAVGALLCLGASAPGLMHLPQFYARSISYDRDAAYWLYWRSPAADTLDVQGWKRATKRFAMNWYLPGLLGSSGDMPAPGYRRMLTLENSLERGMPVPAGGALLFEGFTYGTFGSGLSLQGLLGRSPLAAWPDAQGRYSYRDNFSGQSILRDAHSLHNASPDTRLGVLLPTDWSRPGEAVYHFMLPGGVAPERIEAALRGVLYKRHPASRTGARIDLAAGPSPDALRPVGSITLDDFISADGSILRQGCEAMEDIPIYTSCSRVDRTFDLTPLASGATDLFVRVGVTPGKEEGYLFADDFRLDVQFPGTGKASGSPLARELETLMANGRVSPWRPGAASLDGLFVFAPGDAFVRSLPGHFPALGTHEDLERFRAEHPGLPPVHELRDASGQPLALFFDPALALSDAKPAREVRNGTAFTARGVVLSGRMNGPSLTVGDARLDIPVAAPRGSVLLVNPGGQGRLIWSPDFSKDAFANLDASSQDNLRPTPDADNDGGLTCLEERPCHFMASFVSGLPMSRVRLEWYPRVVAALDGRNVVRLSYSTDQGRSFTVLEEFKGSKTGAWSTMFAKHAAELDFKKPVNHFLLKVELSGEDAQLWSHRRAVDRMWLEATLDARSLAPVQLPQGEFPLKLSGAAGNDFTVRFTQKNVPLFDTIKDWR